MQAETAAVAETTGFVVTNQVAVAAIASYVLQVLKRTRWFPLLSNASSAAAQRWASAIVALGAAAGIHFAWDTTGGVLTITGLTVANGLHLAWDAFQQYVLQHFAYHLGIKGKTASWDQVDRRGNGGNGG